MDNTKSLLLKLLDPVKTQNTVLLKGLCFKICCAGVCACVLKKSSLCTKAELLDKCSFFSHLEVHKCTISHCQHLMNSLLAESSSQYMKVKCCEVFGLIKLQQRTTTESVIPVSLLCQ